MNSFFPGTNEEFYSEEELIVGIRSVLSSSSFRIEEFNVSKLDKNKDVTICGVFPHPRLTYVCGR